MVESRVILEVDLKVLKDNFAKISSTVNDCGVISVLKANAYGLGVEPIAKALLEAGTKAFGVAELSEALQLTKFNLPVMILGDVLHSELELAIQNGVIIPVSDTITLSKVVEISRRLGKTALCHFLVDTGMGRLGIPIENAYEFILSAVEFSNDINFVGIYSHFPVAYRDGSKYTLKQVDLFRELLIKLSELNITFDMVHIANSDAINNFPYTYKEPFNYVRTGINLHGSFDPEGKRILNIKSVLTLKTKLVAIRKLKAGSNIGYGLTYKLSKDSLVGTISAGYADGMPLALSNKGYVIIDNVKCPIVGRVSMDYTNVLLDGVPNPQKGDLVICLGEVGEHSISVEDWAVLKETHPYEVICSFGNRVERKYLK